MITRTGPHTMAEINIKEKEGASWVWWLIALIVLALAAWWFLGRDSENTVTTGAVDSVQTAPVATPANTVITDLSALTGATNADLANRQVALAGAPVANVVSDKGFWIGDATALNSEGIFVLRGNQDASYTAPDGAVNAGQNVSVYGTVLQVPSDLSNQANDWSLRSADQSMLANQPLYIRADSVRIVR